MKFVSIHQFRRAMTVQKLITACVACSKRMDRCSSEETTKIHKSKGKWAEKMNFKQLKCL